MKNTLKYFLLIALGFIVLYGCQQDDFQNHSVHNHESDIKFKRKKISLEDIENKEVIQKKIETLFSKKSSPKYKTTSTINQQNYFLETDEIVYIEDGITHSYTIPMLNLDNPSGLVNLLLSSENGEEYDMYIVEYNISVEEQLRLMTGESVDLENKFTFTKTDEVEISFQNKTTIGSTDGCSTITYVPGVCASGQHQYGDMSCEYLQEPVQIDKIAPPFQNIIISYIDGCGGGGPSPGESETNPNPTNPTNPGPGTGGYNPNPSIKPPSNTTPNIMSHYSKFLNFYLLGKQEIQDWLEAPQNSEEKELIENYLNDTGFVLGGGSVEEQINEKYQFAEEVVNTSIFLDTNVMEVWNNQQEYRGRMSQSELAIFDNLNSYQQMKYLGSAKKASDKAQELFPTHIDLHNGKGDAYRHALWNTLSAMLIGYEITEQLTTAHEEQPSLYPYNWKEKNMDLHNNERGLLISQYTNIYNVEEVVLFELNVMGNMRYLTPVGYEDNGVYRPTWANGSSVLTLTNQ